MWYDRYYVYYILSRASTIFIKKRAMAFINQNSEGCTLLIRDYKSYLKPFQMLYTL